MNPKFFIALFFFVTLVGCKNSKVNNKKTTTDSSNYVDKVVLPLPFATASNVAISKVIEWPKDKKPIAPKGFRVSVFADQLDNPRWIYTAPNGDIFVSLANTIQDGYVKKASKEQPGTKSSNTILLFRDKNNDGIPELKSVFLQKLNRPFGMLILNNHFYVANTDGLYIYPYTEGQTEMTAIGKKIVDLPEGGYNNHWTRNIIANKKGTKIYMSVGSGSDHGENGLDAEIRRACILEFDPDGSNERIYASGIRNPNGLGWATGTDVLWASVNERDGLGDDLVPDYTTSIKENGFYGWPFAYYGKNPDPRSNGARMDLVEQTIIPDIALGSHTSSIGLVFNSKNYLTKPYFGGMFIGQHGSWNRKELNGYRVLFIPFKDGKPSGPPQDFLTGFIADRENNTVYGRPVGVEFTKDGVLLVSDDAGKKIWRVSKQ